MPRNATHTFDGLVVGYGTHTADNSTPAVVSSGGYTIVKTLLVATEIPDTASATNGIATPQAHIFPRGSVITRAFLEVIVPWTGSSSILDIGFWSRGLSGEVVDDADYLWDGGTIAELTTIGEINVLDAAGLPLADGVATGVVGKISNSDVVLTAEWETAVFTAGTAMLTVEYVAPFIVDRILAL